MASLLRYISQVLWQRDTAAPESAATQSRKRSRMEAELDSGQAHAKKRQMSSPSPLLRLPVELRLKILQYLLWQTDTLEGTEEALTSSGQLITPRKCNNFSFCSAILRVCRRLHEEGEPLLYDNTFPCQMWYNRPHQDYAGYRSSLLRGEWDVMQRVDKTGHCESPMRRVPRYLVDNINYQVLSLITFAHQAADLGDLEIFKNARSHLMLLVEILNMEECDRPHGRVILSDLLGKDKWSLGSDYAYFGNASARKARDRREKQSPALGVLRKMWKNERFGF